MQLGGLDLDLELRELDDDTGLGTVVEWISSGVPIGYPEPTALTSELLAARGLRLIRRPTHRGTRCRRCLGYVCPDTELFAPTPPLGLTVHHPTAGICVVTVDGQLDTLSAPVLDDCIRDQLAATPEHLILDLQPVRFLASDGLTCLLRAQHFAQQTPKSQLRLAGLVTRTVARALELTGLLDLFDTYPTLADALAGLAV